MLKVEGVWLQQAKAGKVFFWAERSIPNCRVVMGFGTRRSQQKEKSLPNLSVKQGQIGVGSSPCSLSRAGIRRSPLDGCQLPDAILHGKRSSFRPRSRAGQRLAALTFE
jgi:hypothetical protein